MKIENFRARGFIGFQRGLGLDEIEVDFRGIRGLIAFEGQNGSSKSTLLELLSPYPQLASRDGALFRHTYLRNSEKELSFDYDGSSYRTLLKIDSQGERSEGYIFKNGHPEITGKISAYTKYIRGLLGSPELFFSSVFCAQNSKKLSDLTTGDLKKLFAEFLRLDRLQRWEDTAKQCGSLLGAKVGQLDIRRSALSDRLAGVEGVGLESCKLSGQLADLEARKTAITEKSRDLRGQMENLRETCSKNAMARSRKADLETTVARTEKDLAREKASAEAELEGVRGKFREIKAEIEKCESVLKDREKILGAADREREVSAEIERLTAEVDRLAQEITTLQESENSLQRSLQDLRHSVKLFENDPGLAAIILKISETTKAISDFDQSLYKLTNDPLVIDLAAKAASIREKMLALDLKDPSCQSSTCSFIVDALKARESLPPLEAALSERRDKLAKEALAVETQRKAAAERLGVLEEEKRQIWLNIEADRKRINAETGEKEKELKESQGRIQIKSNLLASSRQVLARARLDLAKVKELAARKADIQVAEARMADLEVRLDETRTKGTLAKEAWEEREREGTDVISVERVKLDQIKKEIDPGAEEELKRTQSTLERVEKESLPALESEITAGREKVAQNRGELARMAEADQELQGVNQDRERLQKDASEWLYLKNACGKDGLQALEIDGTAPLISAHANNLLSQAFGPLYSVKLRTQDDEGREVLDILVIGEDGEEVLLENLSGGQKVWCLMALRLAMTLLSKEKSGRAFESFFSDEMDGPLDPDNAINFINMYQGFMKIGGFSNGFFISHRPSCRALADHVLAFEAGKAPYWK